MITLLIFATHTLAFSQKKVTLINSKPIDPSRYEEIGGSPYMFDEWKLGKVFTRSAMTFDSLEMNYNGFTNSFEVRQDGEYIQLDSKFYPMVVISIGRREVFFTRNNYRKLGTCYTEIIHSSEEVSMIRKFEVTKGSHKPNYPGGMIELDFLVCRAII